MMTKLRSKTKARFKVLVILPVLALLLTAFSGSPSYIIGQDYQDTQKKKQKKGKGKGFRCRMPVFW